MSKYRIVEHKVGDVIRYCPEVWERRNFDEKSIDFWRKLAGNENLTLLDLWVLSLPETIEEAKSIIEKHIEEQKPKYSEKVVYEYDTEKKEQQKKLLTEIMEADQKNGLYDIHDVQKNMTAVEWFIEKVTDSGHLWMTDKPSDMLELAQYIEQAKQMEKEHIEKAYTDGKFCYLLADGFSKNGEQYYKETYGKE